MAMLNRQLNGTNQRRQTREEMETRAMLSKIEGAAHAAHGGIYNAKNPSLVSALKTGMVETNVVMVHRPVKPPKAKKPKPNTIDPTTGLGTWQVVLPDLDDPDKHVEDHVKEKVVSTPLERVIVPHVPILPREHVERLEKRKEMDESVEINPIAIEEDEDDHTEFKIVEKSLAVNEDEPVGSSSFKPRSTTFKKRNIRKKE